MVRALGFHGLRLASCISRITGPRSFISSTVNLSPLTMLQVVQAGMQLDFV